MQKYVLLVYSGTLLAFISLYDFHNIFFKLVKDNSLDFSLFLIPPPVKAMLTSYLRCETSKKLLFFVFGCFICSHLFGRSSDGICCLKGLMMKRMRWLSLNRMFRNL